MFGHLGFQGGILPTQNLKVLGRPSVPARIIELLVQLGKVLRRLLVLFVSLRIRRTVHVLHGFSGEIYSTL